MTSAFKDRARQWVPPALWSMLRRLRRPAVRFVGDFPDWPTAAAHCTGYDADNIAQQVLEATLDVQQGRAAFERDSVLFEQIDYVWPLLSALMWAAARSGGRLDVLDYGGALGSTYFQNKRFLQTLPQVRWNVVEQEKFASLGAARVMEPKLHFYASIAACLGQAQPNVVVLSSVLQYVPEPYPLLEQILALGIEHLILDRTPFWLQGGVEKIRIQETSKAIYAANYPCHFFWEDKMMRVILERGYQEVAAFDALDHLSDDAVWRGHIFQAVR